MGIPWSRSFFARSSLAALGCIISVGCTIGPRTPESAPPAQEDPHPEREDPDEEKFDLPQAESVWDTEGALSDDPRTNDTEPQSKRVGLSRVTLGQRPPWSSLPELAPPSLPSEKLPPATWSLKKSIWIGQGYLHQAEFAADERSVITLSTQNGHFYQFDLDGKLITEVPLPRFREFDDAVFATMREITDRPQLVVARPTGTTLLDLASGQFDAIESIPPGNGVEPTGRPGLYGISYRKISPQSGEILFQWVSGEVAASFICEHRPDDWAMSADGRYLAVSYYPADHVEVVDLEAGAVVAIVPLPKWGSAVAISPDATLMAMGGEMLRVVRFPSGEVIAEDKNYGNNIGEVRFTPQGDLLLASAFDGKARSYALPKDLSTFTKLPRPQTLAHSGQANVYALGLTRDGRMLVTSSGDKTVKIWKR